MQEGSPEGIAIGELADIDSSRAAVKYTEFGKRFHAVYDFDMINAVQSVQDMREIIRTRTEFVGSGEIMTVFTNHDSERAVSNLTNFAVDAGKTDAAAKLLLFLQCTMRGGGILYQGDELGLPQPTLGREDLQDPWGKAFWPDFAGRDGVRTPIPWQAEARHAGFSDLTKPWLPVPDHHASKAIDLQDRDREFVLNFLRDLLAWRRRHPMLRCATQTVSVEADDSLVVYDRVDGAKRLTFVANLSLNPATMAVDAGDRLLTPSSRCANLDQNTLALPELGFAAIQRATARP